MASITFFDIDHYFKIGGCGSDHIRRARLVTIALRRAVAMFDCGRHLRAFHFGDAPQDMQAGREAGVVPIGIATGVFTAQQLTSAGAHEVLTDLTGSDEILHYINSMKI